MNKHREIAEIFVAGIVKEYRKNGLFDGNPEPRFVERLTRDIAKLLEGPNYAARAAARKPTLDGDTVTTAPVDPTDNSTHDDGDDIPPPSAKPTRKKAPAKRKPTT